MEIKDGEYIVVLVDDSNSNSWKNFCFKQKITWDDVIEPETTPKYPKKNDGESYAVTDSMWRYATQEEIERYKVEGCFKITIKPKGPKKSKMLNYYEIF
jgi:hypothetical protein